jgi:dTDP-4-amino-4,6-dideoxygalactose transaminase
VSELPVLPVMRPSLGEEEARAVAEVVASGWIAQGPRVAEFERVFAARVGAAHGVALSSCTAGLHLAMVALGIGPGDEVVVPSLSFIATANAVRYVGARPVFADVDRETGNLTGKTISEVLSPRTAAVILVHQGGMPADVDEVRAICDPLGLPVVEDAACAAGSVYRGRPVGTGALLAAWSFHPRKLLTTGEGGMLTLDGEDEARRLRRLREHGMNMSAADRHASGAPVLESYLEVGYNYRMTDLQAALGIVQVGRLDALVADRRRMVARYRELLAGSGILPIREPAYGESNFQSFWVRLPADSAADRNAVLEVLAAEGISARRGIMAAHLEPAYAGEPHVDLPVTEELTRETLILPLFQGMTEGDQVRVADALRRTVAGAVR